MRETLNCTYLPFSFYQFQDSAFWVAPNSPWNRGAYVLLAGPHGRPITLLARLSDTVRPRLNILSLRD